MKVSVIGLGYVGLVTAASLAKIGHTVLGYDSDGPKMLSLIQGEVPFYEPGLGELVRHTVEAASLRFTDTIDDLLKDAEVVFIAVGTPPNTDGSSNLDNLHAVVRLLGEQMINPTTVVIKSTVPVGTNLVVGRTLADAMAAKGRACEFQVVSNPEFLREGSAVNDALYPERIVVGTTSDHALKVMQRLYAPFAGKCPLLEMNPESAELAKYAANAFLAARISLVNEISWLAQDFNADIEQITAAVGTDSRIGPQFLRAGIGYGGSCFSKDLRSLKQMLNQHGYEPMMCEAIERVNFAQSEISANRIIRRLGKETSNSTVAILGLTFKPDTDDMRDGPAIRIVDRLLAAGAHLNLHNPILSPGIQSAFPKHSALKFFDNVYEAATDCNALILATEWSTYQEIDFDKLSQLMRNPTIFDGRNIWDPEKVRNAGFEYHGVGRE